MLVPLALAFLGLAAHPSAAAPRQGAPVLTVTNLRHNLVGIWEVRGATPNRNVAFFVSLSGPGPSALDVGACVGANFSLSPQLRLLGTDRSDASGTALVTFAIPINAGGRSVWSQAIDLGDCQVSNMVFGVVG